ncbi:GNAT family N-acetyltransferase [Actinomadura litoris]|uniref:GNAT family N-acetyltransferase n=1 Tax=Actinomadura litoris TaxID=2678616 RepID=UPI001FA7CEA8|nr:GNAT family N-acetyltransferase [Actinomadura litoris]
MTSRSRGGVNLEGELAAAATHGSLGAVVTKGLVEGSGVLTYEPATAVSQEGEGTVQEVVLGLTCVLVAEHPRAGVVGTLPALPPARALSHVGIPEMESLVGLVKVVKLKAVAVDPAHRRGGIAAALIATCRQLYTNWAISTVRAVRVGSGLETYYRQQGLSVLEEGQGVSLTMFSVPAGIYTEPTERLFVCDLA